MRRISLLRIKKEKMTTPAPASSLNGPEASEKTPEQGLKCPRCDSNNTKFCYYNNYSLSQPRHFCKTCRRYWTKGGALRNVPFGGGSRKNRKSRSTAMLSSPSTSPFFHFGGYAAYSSAISSSPLNAAGVSPLIILDCPAPAAPFFKESSVATTTSEERRIATSIESLSSINQDLHWKLQQKRLATLFAGEGIRPEKGAALEFSRRQDSPSIAFSSNHSGGATACFLESSTAYAPGVENNSFESAVTADWTGTWNQVHKFGGLQ